MPLEHADVDQVWLGTIAGMLDERAKAFGTADKRVNQ
jgi:hypothetical protein